MSTYRAAPPEILDMVRNTIADYHPELVEHGVTVDVQFANAARDDRGEPKGPALSKEGLAVFGKTKIMSQSDRIGGASDMRIILDGDRWDDLDEDEQKACIDHYLSCIELKLDDEGNATTDDCFRPCLKRRPYDFCAAGFTPVANRHGDSSLEAKSLMNAQKLVADALIGAEVE